MNFLANMKFFGGELLNKKIASSISLGLLLFSIVAISLPLVLAKPAGVPRDGTHQIYVSSQGKYYDTIVPIPASKGLPWNEHNTGSFQPIVDGVTPFGPGDPGYRGGRWWVDSNPNGYQDAYDTFFLCPLLGPGVPGLPPT